MRLFSYDGCSLRARRKSTTELIPRGHKSTKVTALRMNSEVDGGPVYKKEEMDLHGSAEEIYRRAGALCWQMIHG